MVELKHGLTVIEWNTHMNRRFDDLSAHRYVYINVCLRRV